MRHPLEAAGAAAGEELLLPDERLRRPAAGALRGAPGLRAAGVGTQRGRVVRAPRAQRPLHLAVELRLGHQGAVGRVARRVRVVRRAAQLRDSGRLRAGRGELRAPLAGDAPGRQGHPALPRRHLARHADGRRARGAAPGLRARLAAGRRREDVQVQADRHRADADHRHVRLRRVPLLLPARDQLRAGRLVQLGGPRRALPGRTGQRFRQPGVARDRDGHPLLRGRRAAGIRVRGGRPPRAAGRRDGRSRRRRRDEPVRDPRRARRGVDHRGRVERLYHHPGAVVAGEGRRQARAPPDRALHRGRGTARARRAAVAGRPEGDGEAVDGARRDRGARPAGRAAAAEGRRLGPPARRHRGERARGAVPAHRGGRGAGA